MKNKSLRGWLAACALALSLVPAHAQTPPDVRSDHWALPAVRQVLTNHVMGVESDRGFHGEAKLTHAEALIALGKLAHALQDGQWKRSSSVAVPDKVTKTLQARDWALQPVTRYSGAVALARIGDYISNGISRPAPGSKDLGKSVVTPAVPKITLPPTHPAYEALRYLASHHMIGPDSPLLKADSKPLLGGEMSRALAQVVIGLNDQWTALGMDENGNTPDKTFHSKPK